MLFDLRGRGRRNTIKVIYASLAFLMGGGLVLFGIGGETSGGLVDAITGGGGGADTGQERFEKQEKTALAKLKTNPNDEVAHVELIRAQVNQAGTEGRYDANTDTYSEAGKAALRKATLSWTAYQAIEPKNAEEEANVAKRIVQAYAALEDLPNLVATQEIVALNREAVGPFAQLAQYAYLAGQTRKGDLAAAKAVELEDPDQREQLKGELKTYKEQGALNAAATPAPVQTVTAEPEKTAAPKGKKTGKKKPSGK